jgi:MFS family permease
MWYKRNEQPLRIAFWYGSSGLGSLIGGIVFFGIGHIQGALHPWKYQYLILGSVTVLWGIVVVCFLPDNPIMARFLSADERILAVKRMQSAQTGISNSVFKATQVVETLRDPKTYLLVLTAFTITLINGALSGYGAIILGSFGYSDFKAVLFSGIPGSVVFVTLITTGYVADLVARSQSTVKSHS